MSRIRAAALLVTACRASVTPIASTSRHIAAIPSKRPRSRSLSVTRALRTPVDRLERDSLPAGNYSISTLSNEDYDDVSNATMDALTDYLESIIEDGGPQLRGCDVEYTSGVLTLNMAGHGIYVINKQPPNKQIWLSSPISGPKRYDFDSQQRTWFNARDGTRLQDLLNAELSPMADEEIRVDMGHEG